ncbi:hypothetical protein WMY93_011563 [Mugilogobius chulae]|uniref:GH18 domain-containing protein n=1 Tax=Mugilogobius chulae TaxID=88201 RepID=A0AAW0PBU0_9GOBI
MATMCLRQSGPNSILGWRLCFVGASLTEEVEGRRRVFCRKLVCYYDRDAATRASTGGFTPANIDPNLFSTMVAAENSRSKFISSAITLLKDNGFDGLNLDWHYPGDEKKQPKDKERFVLLCQELQTAFAPESLILSATVSAKEDIITNSYPDPTAIANAVDFLNVLTFDFYDPSNTVTAHHSPLGALTTGDTLNTQYAMKHWVGLNVPAAKLNMGFAAFGVAYTLTDPNVSGVGAATNGSAEEGCYGGKRGIWSYYETCLYIQGGSLQWISEQSVPYAVTEGQWVGYDNNDSIDAKVADIASNGYGGAFVWALDLDDYTGQFCKAGINPFINHLKSKLSTI